MAFCGRTGSGKTSILNCLFKLYDITGDIFIRGENIEEISLNKLRHGMSIIPQFGFLFKGSFKENIDPEDLLDDDEI